MATTSTNTDHPPPITLDSSDPLNLIIHTTPMDDNNDTNATPPDWSQLSSLWPEHDSAVPHSNSKPPFNEYLDFNMASGLLDMDLDMSSLGGTIQLGPGGIEPSALHLDRFGYPSYDDSFSFPASASPADILAAQFPFTFQPDALMDTSGVLQTPNTNQRRLSITSSSSSSGPSFSPAPESIPSPGYGYTSDSSTQQSFSTPELLPSDHTFSPADSAPVPVTATTGAVHQEDSNTKVAPDFSANPAAELAYRVCQSAGVMRAVPMNGNSTFQPGQQVFPSPNSLQAKLPIPRLQQQQQQQRQTGNNLIKSGTPSATSSAASTPPPSTPPSNSSNESTPALPTQGTTSTIPSVSASASASAVAAAAIANTAHVHTNIHPNNRPKTSHTTIERRYRTNLNARIQSLRMAVPALRVLEDRDSGSSKKIKKNLKGGVLIQKSSSSPGAGGAGATTTVIAVPGDPSPSNPYGEVDVIDERGYVDGVKVARKCSKANVLGKAVEYIRVLKRREGRLKAEQEGLKTLLCGLVGGPALLREWEREWRERFGGEERDEVDPEERDVDDDEEGEEDEVGVDEQEDEDGAGVETGKKRKRAKLESKDSFGSVGVPVVMVKKEPKPPSVVVIGADGQPEKRKRGRPRKVPLPQQHSNSASPVMQGNNSVVGSQTTEQPQQYLLAVFALFSFFNSPLTSSSSSAAPHTHQGHVISPPLAYAPEILSQFTPPPMITASVTWRDWVQVAHLAVTVLLFISVLVRMAEGFGFGRIRKLIKGGDASVNKRVEKVILGTEPVTSLTSAITLYRSLSPETTSPIIKALFLYTIASTSSPSSCMKYLIKMRANSIWNNAPAIVTTKKERVTLSNSIEKVFFALPSIRSTLQTGEEEELVDSIAAYIIKQKLGRVLGKMFVREVTGSFISQEKGKEKEKEVAEVETEMSDEEIKAIIEAAKDLGGEVSLLAKNVERVRASSDVVSSVIGWSASPMTPQSLIRDDDGDDEDDDNESDSSSSSGSLSYSLLSEDSALDEEEGDEDVEGVDTNMPFTVLRALVLYRSLFSSSSSSVSSTSLSTLTPTISIEPPTPTIPSPLLSHLHTRAPVTTTIPKNTTTKTTTMTMTVGNGARKRMYALRKLLGSRVFEKDEVEDARDRVVDMLVEAERRSARTSPARV